jgi:Uma2 family endonuclease
MVVPSKTSTKENWHELRDYWLAVEVYSRSSRIYDHDFKRDNYLRMGVKEVWLVDRIERTVEVTREIGRSEIMSDTIVWQPPTLDFQVRIELADIFAGIE